MTLQTDHISMPSIPAEVSNQRSVTSRTSVAGTDSHESTVPTASKTNSARTKTRAETSPSSHKSAEPQSTSRSGGTQSNREELLKRQERARTLFEKYDVQFDTSLWDTHPKSQRERVHKAPRIRVRWTCHECKTTFGHDMTCVECAHHRCRSCARNPPKRNKTKAAKAAALATDRSNPSNDEGHEGRCHECQANFQIGLQECSNCHHRICDRCLRESLPSDRRVQTTATEAGR